MVNPTCFLEVSIGGNNAGRMVFELFADTTPRTAQNFLSLCTGEKGEDLHYLNRVFHRVIPGFMAQGGKKGDASSSIYGGKFDDENFIRKHIGPGLLSMANRGPNTNGSQFFITFKSTPHLNGKHVVFGRLIEGMDVLRRIEHNPCNSKDVPKRPVKIIQCGAGDGAQTQSDSVKDVHVNAKASSEAANEDTNVESVAEKQEEPEPVVQIPTDPMQRRLFEMRMKVNESRKLNQKEVVTEKKRLNGQQVTYKKRKLNDEGESGAATHKFMTETSGSAQGEYAEQERKAYNRSMNKEWNVWNTDTQFRHYEKQTASLNNRADREVIDRNEVKLGQHKPNVNAVDAMAKQVQKAVEKRSTYSKQSRQTESETVDSISEKNRLYNKQLKKAYDPYTVELRQNLERGTAM